MHSSKILIIGAGQAGIYAASEIRKHDQDSAITIFGDENYLPYERPPLSKDFLFGSKKIISIHKKILKKCAWGVGYPRYVSYIYTVNRL